MTHTDIVSLFPKRTRRVSMIWPVFFAIVLAVTAANATALVGLWALRGLAYTRA